MADSRAANLKAISDAIDVHDRNCGRPAVEIRMAPFEVERLGWDEIRGVPIVGDPAMQTGRVLILCEHDLPAGAVNRRVEVVAGG